MIEVSNNLIKTTEATSCSLKTLERKEELADDAAITSMHIMRQIHKTLATLRVFREVIEAGPKKQQNSSSAL